MDTISRSEAWATDGTSDEVQFDAGLRGSPATKSGPAGTASRRPSRHHVSDVLGECVVIGPRHGLTVSQTVRRNVVVDADSQGLNAVILTVQPPPQHLVP